MQESADITERDLVLIDALQRTPRAPWSRIGRAIGVDATTAARRWQRLADAGLAWMTAYLARGTAIGYVAVRCRPDALDAAAEQARRWRCVFNVDRTTGEHQLLLSVTAADFPALDDLVSVLGRRLPGVRAVRLSAATLIYGEGSTWFVRALDSEQQAVLGQSAAQSRRTPASRFDAADRALIAALGDDARRSCAELARACGLSETATRRRVDRLLRRSALHFRCDLAQQPAGWPVIVTYRLCTPSGEADGIGTRLAEWPQTRLCALVTGEPNLLLQVWLPTTEECHRFETLLARSFSGLRVASREITLHSMKRMGRLLRPDGVAVDHVPVAAWGGLRGDAGPRT